MACNHKIIFQENAALCDQVAQVQENILVVKEERRFLLKKLYQFEPHSDLEVQASSKGSFSNVSASGHSDHKKSKKRQNSDNAGTEFRIYILFNSTRFSVHIITFL